MITLHKPGSVHELKRIVPLCALGLFTAFALPIEWFPKFSGRYGIFIAYCLVIVGMDAISTSIQAAGLVKSVSSLPVRGFLSARILNILAATSFMCVLIPIVFLIPDERFNWIGTLLVMVLLTLGVANRIGARRILRDCEVIQQGIDTGKGL